ncbi:MAG TPA: acyl-CoA dehydrogenase [Candidatus Marinimicrobia bacterium]|jgi:alkylation response protein AidB-like acyl-CoA dehydrogenase|nr:acyl-CoA dehydrogenase [Candidatus Neomarinimicrobiota bacterium]MDP6276824.1 acyl-CoA dehydrogenase [Candidatus Neomarinimicrobiota bacterium]MDP7217389.1 acyl-CoA dehydrogenase [Candidatus Neomarinimicrobiota bacterium]MDP7437371.1 acyl-CoA dehydrogenase [Candidatus Neomarinimicrobiota bacterium]HJM69783.1 acyl-CoA dehydrogenase [Candidatus Neomarinimicrobiota bacterium]|tara:strand:- start:86 stop:1228 length:1143 start_codon:yes stop_codon:yes gene_type:complete
MDFSYTEEQQLIQKTAREFAQEHLAPGVIERDEKAEFPKEQLKLLGELGFMGMMIPEEWGGAGLDTISFCIAMEEICAVDASMGVIMSVNNSLVCQLLYKYANDDQRDKYLKKLASGEWLGAFSLSEPQSGSDASNMLTFAKNNGDHYIINGTKNWVSNGISCDIAIVFLMTEKGIGHKGISAFIVEKGTVGFSHGKKEDKLGIRGSDTCELYFEDCNVSAENLIGEEGKGFKIALGTLDGGRIGIASQALGIARSALDRSVEYANERKQFGKTIGSFGAIQDKIATIATNVDASRMLIHKAAKLKDVGKPFSKEAAMAKVFASQTAMDAATDCVQIFGGYGYMQEYGVERLMRDAKITQIYEGTSEIQQLVIARSVLGD